METINLKDLEAIAAKHDYKHVGLLNSTGETIVSPFGLKTLAEKCEQIRKRFNGQKDGTYVVRYQYAVGKKKPHYDFYVVKGEGEAQPVNIPTIIHTPPMAETSVRGWNEALEDKKKIAELEAEKKALQIQNAALNAVVDEEEEEGEEEEENGLTEKIKGFSETVLPQLMPLADQFFSLRTRALDLKERELALKEAQINRRPNLRTVHPFRPVPQPTDAATWEKYLDWMDSVPEEVFVAEMAYVQQNQPQIFPALLEVFPPQDENEEEKTA